MPNLQHLKNDLMPLLLLSIAFLSSLLAPSAFSQTESSVESRLAELESREQIREVMKQYGRYLDLGDFDAFGRLFAETDSTYVSGRASTKGGKAIAQGLKEIFSANPSGLKSPAFHVFFNEVIKFNSPSEATAFSQSVYIVPGESNAPEMVFFASYEDIFIIENDQWKFKQRIVSGEMP